MCHNNNYYDPCTIHKSRQIYEFSQWQRSSWRQSRKAFLRWKTIHCSNWSVSLMSRWLSFCLCSMLFVPISWPLYLTVLCFLETHGGAARQDEERDSLESKLVLLELAGMSPLLIVYIPHFLVTISLMSSLFVCVSQILSIHVISHTSLSYCVFHLHLLQLDHFIYSCYWHGIRCLFVCSDYIGYDAPSKFFNSLMDYEKHPELLGYIIFQANSTEPHSLARSLNGYPASQRRTMIAEAKKDPSKLFDWLMSHGHGLIGLRHNGDMQVAWRLIKHLRTIASRFVFMYVLCFAVSTCNVFWLSIFLRIVSVDETKKLKHWK